MYVEFSSVDPRMAMKEIHFFSFYFHSIFIFRFRPKYINIDAYLFRLVNYNKIIFIDFFPTDKLCIDDSLVALCAARR